MEKSGIPDRGSHKRGRNKSRHWYRTLLGFPDISDCSAPNTQTGTPEQPRKESTNDQTGKILRQTTRQNEDCKKRNAGPIDESSTKGLAAGSCDNRTKGIAQDKKGEGDNRGQPRDLEFVDNILNAR